MNIGKEVSNHYKIWLLCLNLLCLKNNFLNPNSLSSSWVFFSIKINLYFLII